MRDVTNQRAGDGFSRVQGGFRLDWDGGGRDAVTLQADAYGGSTDQGSAPKENISGRNVLVRWTRSATNGNRLELQAYYDYTHRGTPPTGLASTINTYDLSLQQNFGIGRFNALTVGGGHGETVCAGGR